ncbi:hypothetical protein T11_1070 [Trichinella zimbabwensis]|uniref:Uncharacterized protein n=1 Tax=Trichinella zimbabwensis TaxID=268475 RepID=A0A0V1HIS4_9BILA|nr:hypothetical protein T11_1070 [Trichinella zimbabwensis]
MNNQQHENRMLTLERLNLAWKLLQKSKILPANYLFKQLLLVTSHKNECAFYIFLETRHFAFATKMGYVSFLTYCIFKITNLYTIDSSSSKSTRERGGVQPLGDGWYLMLGCFNLNKILNYYQDKRRSICRSTVVSESDPRANGTRCFGLFDVS